MTAVTSVVIVVLCCMFLTGNVDGAYFRLKSALPVCFTEEISYQSATVLVEWHRKRSSYADDVRVTSVVTSPVSKKEMIHVDIREGSGSYSFKPVLHEFGEYDICFMAPEMETNSDRYVEISVSINHHDRKQLLPKIDPGLTRQKAQGGEVFEFIDYDGQPKDTLRTHEYLERVRDQLFRVQTDMEDVKNEVAYFQQRDGRMRSTTESTFDRIWGFSVVTMLVLATVSWLQYWFLKELLREKKRV